MNDLTLQIKYKSMKKSVATALCLLWFAVSAILFCCAHASVTTLPWYLALLAWIASGFLFVYVPFVIVSSYREGGLLVINNEGMVVPPTLLGFGQSTVTWEQLKSIDCTEHEQPVLTLARVRNWPIVIQTKSISQDELSRLMHAIELWAPSARWSGRVADFRDRVQSYASGDGFTKLWDDELRRRYNITAFTPHEPGLKLQSGAYTVQKQLAFGGFSAIYLAENQLREKVVIKQLVTNASPEVQAKSLLMLQREAQILSRLNHERIVRVLDHFVEDEGNYLVLEHVEGENLVELVRRQGPLSAAEATRLALQMVSILEYLHTLTPPLVHRDFTPDNLILKANGELMLVDFGTTTEYVRSTTGTLVGKQSYMPIEQIRGKAEPRTDLYAMGGTLHFLVTGQDPQPLTVCSGRGRQLGSVIQRLMQSEPSDRFTDIGEVRSELLAIKFSPIQC